MKRPQAILFDVDGLLIETGGAGTRSWRWAFDVLYGIPRPGAVTGAAANGMAGAGVALAVAAGNSDANMNNSSPARAANAITVTALADFNGTPGGGASPTCRIDQDDTLADFSNWGTKTYEIAAPGVCILSSWLNGGYNTISGTSMASPHVAGALALLASRNNPSSLGNVQGLYSTLISNGNMNWTDDSDDKFQESLLDVSSSSVFNPVMTVGSGGGGGGDTTPPANPTGLAASAGDGSVTLDWNDSPESDLAGYNVYRSTLSGGPYTKVNGALRTASDYSDSGLANGTTYYYVVRAVDTSTNQSGNSNQASATPTGSTAGTTVTLSSSSTNNGSTWAASVTVTTNSNAAVTWTWSNGATGSGSCNTTPCTVNKSGIAKRTGSVTFTVDKVAGSTNFGGTTSTNVSKP